LFLFLKSCLEFGELLFVLFDLILHVSFLQAFLLALLDGFISLFQLDFLFHFDLFKRRLTLDYDLWELINLLFYLHVLLLKLLQLIVVLHLLVLLLPNLRL